MMTGGGSKEPQLTAFGPVPINLAQTTRNADGITVPASGSGNPHVGGSTSSGHSTNTTDSTDGPKPDVSDNVVAKTMDNTPVYMAKPARIDAKANDVLVKSLKHMAFRVLVEDPTAVDVAKSYIADVSDVTDLKLHKGLWAFFDYDDAAGLLIMSVAGADKAMKKLGQSHGLCRGSNVIFSVQGDIHSSECVLTLLRTCNFIPKMEDTPNGAFPSTIDVKSVVLSAKHSGMSTKLTIVCTGGKCYLVVLSKNSGSMGTIRGPVDWTWSALIKSGILTPKLMSRVIDDGVVLFSETMVPEDSTHANHVKVARMIGIMATCYATETRPANHMGMYKMTNAELRAFYAEYGGAFIEEVSIDPEKLAEVAEYLEKERGVITTSVLQTKLSEILRHSVDLCHPDECLEGLIITVTTRDGVVVKYKFKFSEYTYRTHARACISNKCDKFGWSKAIDSWASKWVTDRDRTLMTSKFKALAYLALNPVIEHVDGVSYHIVLANHINTLGQSEVSALSDKFDAIGTQSPASAITMEKKTLVAVIGPIGAGKSGIANAIAKDLGCEHFDSDTIDGIPAHQLGKYRIQVQQHATVKKLMITGILVVSSNGSPFCRVYKDKDDGATKAIYDFEHTLSRFGIDPKSVDVCVVHVGATLTIEGIKGRMIGRITRDPIQWGLKMSGGTAANEKKRNAIITKHAEEHAKRSAYHLFGRAFDAIRSVYIDELPDKAPDPEHVSKLVNESGLYGIEFARNATQSYKVKTKWTGLFVIDANNGLHITATYDGVETAPGVIEAFSGRSVRCAVFRLSVLGKYVEIAIPVDRPGFTRVHITLKDDNAAFQAQFFGNLAESINRKFADLYTVLSSSGAATTWSVGMKGTLIDVEANNGEFVQMTIDSCGVKTYTTSGLAMF